MTSKNKDAAGSLLILLAGVLWGSMGLFVRSLSGRGFDSLQITAGRLCFAALFFWLILLFRPKEERAIRLRDLPLFLGLGLASILFVTVCYFDLCLFFSVCRIKRYCIFIDDMIVSVSFIEFECFAFRKSVLIDFKDSHLIHKF